MHRRRPAAQRRQAVQSSRAAGWQGIVIGDNRLQDRDRGVSEGPPLPRVGAILISAKQGVDLGGYVLAGLTLRRVGYPRDNRGAQNDLRASAAQQCQTVGHRPLPNSRWIGLCGPLRGALGQYRGTRRGAESILIFDFT